MNGKTKPSQGDEVIFQFDGTKWKVHVKYASGGISGRVMPFDSFEDAVASVKQTIDLD